jgi:nucleotide-binding STING sensor domain-containing protein
MVTDQSSKQPKKKRLPAADQERTQLCFVIGPMNDEHMPKLRALAKKIIAPVLPKNFVVKTPDEFGAGNVMNQVMASCDTAALVIADTTGNNPNVLYEIGVLDSLGRLCIPVKLKADAKKKKTKNVKDPLPFDRAAYRCFFLDLKNPDRARKEISEVIDKSLAGQKPWKPEENPVTNFYRAPLAEISPAFGIALGYCENFVKNLVRDLTQYRDGALKPILYGASREEKDMTPLPPDVRGKMKLDIVIPERLNYADHKAIATNLVAPGLLKHAVIKMDFNVESRSLPVYIWPDLSALVDIPTAMNVMRKSIKRRLGGLEKIDDRSPEWRALEAEEINRFQAQLEANMFDPEQEPMVRTHARKILWSETPLKNAVVL